MRISLKRTVRWLLLLAVVQLTVYYWFITPGWRSRTQVQGHLVQLARQTLGGHGTCNDQLCGQAKEGVLNVHIVAHSHVDVGWLKTADQYYTGEDPHPSNSGSGNSKPQCVRCVLNTTISELVKNPDRKFIFIEMAFFKRFWDESDSDTKTLVRQLIERRQLEIVLGGWVMSDAAVTYYNDIIDQLTLGFDFIQETLGACAQSRVAWHVDQFGHSREHAAIFAKMGFDGLFIGRADFQDHENRKKTQRLEFLWETSANTQDHASHLFTQLTYDGYYSPPGFVLDGVSLDFVLLL